MQLGKVILFKQNLLGHSVHFQDVPFKKDEKLQLFSKKNSLEIGWEKVVQKFNGVNEKSFYVREFLWKFHVLDGGIGTL